MKHSELNVALVNVRGLLSCVDEVQYCMSMGLDISCLNETWLDARVSDCEVCPKGWSILRKIEIVVGGGVVIMISDTVCYVCCSDVSGGNLESIISIK